MKVSEGFWKEVALEAGGMAWAGRLEDAIKFLRYWTGCSRKDAMWVVERESRRWNYNVH